MTAKCSNRTCTRPLSERYVVDDNTGCWNWTGALNSHGYGLISVGRKTRTASRVSFEEHYGEIPKGLCVLHKCDNPKCINPEHLFLGTQKDNSDDKKAKGRAGNLSGDKHPCSKLTLQDVLAIRANVEGISQAAWARRLGVSDRTINHIVARRNWKTEGQ